MPVINRLLPDNIREMIGEANYSPTRASGRTTAIALKALATAIENPGLDVTATDHFPTRSADMNLRHVMQDMAGKLGLRYLTFHDGAGGAVVRADHIVKGLRD